MELRGTQKVTSFQNRITWDEAVVVTTDIIMQMLEEYPEVEGRDEEFMEILK
jgi:hypothetical protein